MPPIRIGGGGASNDFLLDVLTDAAQDLLAETDKTVSKAIAAVAGAAAKKTIAVAITVAARLPKLKFVPGLLPGVVLTEAIEPPSLGMPEYNPLDYLPGGIYYRPGLAGRIQVRPAWLADP